MEQRICFKCCVANEISYDESLQMLLKAFIEDRTVVSDFSRYSQPSTSTTEGNIEKIQKIVHDNLNLSFEFKRDGS